MFALKHKRRPSPVREKDAFVHRTTGLRRPAVIREASTEKPHWLRKSKGARHSLQNDGRLCPLPYVRSLNRGVFATIDSWFNL